MKILFTGAGNLKNNGIYAMVIATYEQIKKNQPECEFYLLSRNTLEDQLILRNKSLKVVDEYWMKLKKNKIKFLVNCLYNLLILFISRYNKQVKFQNETLKVYRECELIVDLSGDSISTDYGNYGLVLALYNICLGLVTGKRVILYCQTIGPFNNRFLRRITLLILNRVTEIILREQRSLFYLQKIKIKNKNIKASTDCAFLLEPVFDNLETIIQDNYLEVLKENKVIGFSPSSIIFKWFKDAKLGGEMEAVYTEKIAQILDEITAKYDCKILLIPHVTLEWSNDRNVCLRIHRLMSNKQAAIIMNKDYNAAEIKAIMSYCHLYVAFRMHAAIGAISMGVPTVCFSYNDKFEGVIGENLNLMEFVINVREHSLNTCADLLMEKIDYIVKNHDAVTQRINRKMALTKKQARENIINLLNQKTNIGDGLFHEQ